MLPTINQLRTAARGAGTTSKDPDVKELAKVVGQLCDLFESAQIQAIENARATLTAMQEQSELLKTITDEHATLKRLFDKRK